MTNHCYLSLGTNLGNKEENILEAYRRIEECVGAIIRRSSFYRSEPWGFESENEFVNTVICCETCLTPHEVLSATQQIEHEMGRTVKSINGEYHDRIIDIDILLYNDLSINEPNLTIPHPLMHERDFVMIPLKEIRQ